MRGHDWAATPLGAVDTWPQSLRTAVDICLASGFASYVWWGPELTQIYNEAALSILCDRHPAAFGGPARQCWSDAWPVVGPRIDRVLATGEPELPDNMVMGPVRGGPRQEARFTFGCSAIRNESGAIAGLFITAIETDARGRAETERRAREEQARLLAGELQHRVRNTLAVVRSIARRTAELSETTEDCAMHLDARLGAFGRVRSASLRNPQAGVDLEMLIVDELRAVGAEEGDQLRPISGPKLRIESKAAETLALAVHELATNALKFGALATERGRLQVQWTIEQRSETQLVLMWSETGLDLPEGLPARRGFGTELIERSLPYDLGGEGRLFFEPSGLCCEIALPLARVLAR